MASVGQLHLKQLRSCLGSLQSEGFLRKKSRQVTSQAYTASAHFNQLRSVHGLRHCSSAPRLSLGVLAGLRNVLKSSSLHHTRALSQSRSSLHQSTVRCSASSDSKIEKVEAPTGDTLVKALSAANEVSVIAVVGSRLVQEATFRHKTSPTASAALGRALLGSLLLASAKGTKGETLQIMFRGNGPIGQVTAVADGTGRVRGFVGNPEANPDLRNGKLDVGAAVGEGILSVVRNHPSWPQPYTGMVKIRTGEIADDITWYLAESEQSNGAVGLGVLVNNTGAVTAAGGWLVEILPSCSEITLQILEENLASLPSATTMVNDGWSAHRVVETILDGVGVGEWTEESHPSFGPCDLDTLRPRMERALGSLGKKDLDDARETEGQLEVRCEFCNETVIFGAEDLQRIAAIVEPYEVS